MTKFFGPGSKSRTITKLQDILPDVSRNLALDERVKDMAIRSLWDQVVPSEFVERSCFVKLKRREDGVELMIRVCDAPTAGELSFHTEHLRDRLNDYAPQTGLFIQRIRLTVGRVKK